MNSPQVSLRHFPERVAGGWIAWACGGLVLLLPAILLRQDAAGWLVLELTFALILALRIFRRNRSIAFIMFLSLSVRHAVAIANAYVTPLIGSDAIAFQNDATELATSRGALSFAVGAPSYKYFLSLFYRLFGPSHFLGEELSILAFVLSCIVFIKILDHLDIRRWRVALLALFAFLPTSIILSSVTLRESWEVLFYLLLSYAMLRARARLTARSVLGVIASAACLGVLHPGLAIYAVGVTTLGLSWAFGVWNRSAPFGKRCIGVVVACVLVAGFVHFSPVLGNVSASVTSGKSTHLLDERYDAAVEARADYRRPAESTPASLSIHAPLILVGYMMAPFPWQVRTPADAYGSLEGFLRLALFVCAFAEWRRRRGERRSENGFLLLSIVLAELLWAVGTFNWGTALRHHLPAFGLLVILGGPGTFDRIFGFRRLALRRDATHATQARQCERASVRLPGNING